MQLTPKMEDRIMQDLKSFWRQQDQEPVSFAQAVERAIGQLNAAGWQSLIFAVEGLLLQRTFRAMTGGLVSPLRLDEYQPTLRTVSLAHCQPTSNAERRRGRARSSNTSTVPSDIWGPREVEAIMTMAVTGVNATTVPPGSDAALKVLARMRVGLATATARKAKNFAQAPLNRPAPPGGSSPTDRQRH
jgi:hypothetical protein